MYKFQSIYKSTLWGGNKIASMKQVSGMSEPIGESWEISGVEGCLSVVAEGKEAGLTLPQLINSHREKLLGKKNYERFRTRFPLLIKLIDARQDLSIQVHPTDELARRNGFDCGKTEMWVLMESDKDATIRVGFNQTITPEEYRQRVENHTICDVIANYQVKAGDCFFLPAGRIHSIGAGCMLAEIQQTSDVTYRIYDFNRRDKAGQLRPLHTEQAAECIDYHVLPDYQTHYTLAPGTKTQLVACPYFTTSILQTSGQTHLDYSSLDSFVILIVLKGTGLISEDGGNPVPVSMGQTLLLPATTQHVDLQGNLEVVETYII